MRTESEVLTQILEFANSEEIEDKVEQHDIKIQVIEGGRK